jgi:polysaccharide pyruvyl transferase WcaK-like protein
MAGGRRGIKGGRPAPSQADQGEPASPRIGLWGTFDLENFGDMLFPRILEEELGRRLPAARTRVFSPVGYTGLNRFEERPPAEPLGPWSPARVAELAEELDCVVVGPGEIIHTRDELLGPHYGLDNEEMRRRAPSRFFIDGLGPELETECPVVWCAVGIPFDIRAREAGRFREALADRPLVTLRDELSVRRLRAAGVSRDVEIVPDPAFLSPRLFSPRLLTKRLAQLRAVGTYPEEPPIVVQGNAASLLQVPALAAALERLREEREDTPVLIVETGPCHGDGEFSKALREALPGSMALSLGGLTDVTAAISASAGFIGTSLHGNIIALTYDRPHLVLAWGRETKLEGFASAIDNPDCLVDRAEDVPGAFEKAATLGSRAEVVAELQQKVDGCLDQVAAMAAEAFRKRERAPEESSQARMLEALRHAHEARGRMLAGLRWTLADRLSDLDDEIVSLKRQIRQLEEEVAGRGRELEDLLNTKTFRYTASLRRLYQQLRRQR